MPFLRNIMEIPIDLEQLKKKFAIEIHNPDLFQEALTHRSYLNEHKDYRHPHNERLEFLGDAVLELVVTKYLFDHFDNPEGELTSFRAALVNGSENAYREHHQQCGDQHCHTRRQRPLQSAKEPHLPLLPGRENVRQDHPNGPQHEAQRDTLGGR